MKAIDIIKGPAKTELEVHKRKMNQYHSEAVIRLELGKRIEVKQVSEVTCKGFGRRHCEEQGKHSWFNHSQDTFRNGSLDDNLPVNFIGCEL